VSAPRVPERIGPFVIHGVIGRGGMGVVYDAERGGVRVAVKTVVGAKARTMAAVRREIRALRRLQHPGIVAVIADGVCDGVPWYAMPFVEGLSLRANRHEEALLALHAVVPPPGEATMHTEAPTVTHAGSMLSHDPGLTRAEALLPAMPGASASSPSGSTGTGGRVGVRVGEVLDPLALPRVLRVVRRLAGALAYLHGEGLVHRDLKPDNVIVRPGDRPVLVDFGLVSMSTGHLSRDVVDDLASLGAGTAAYMAPEQVQGEPLDARVDLYALGCILYELVRGRPPFVGDSVASLLHQHVRVEPPPLSSWVPWVPPDLDALVLELLQKRRQDRCGHASDVVARLADIGRALGDTSGDPPAPAARPVVYRPGLVGRASDLATLSARVEQLRSDGGVVLLVGPSGVGKTRLAVEAARQAGAVGAVVIEGAAHAHLTPPLGPLRGVLAAIAESCTRGGAQRTRALLGPRARALAAFLPDLVVVPGFEAVARDAADESVSPSAARERLVVALHETLALLARERPLLIVLDDVHHADELTLAVLEHLARQPRLVGVLILATVRDREGERVIARLARSDDAGADVVTIAPIGADDVAAMVQDATGGARWSATDVGEVITRAVGLPFLVSECIHAVVVDGVAPGDLPRDPLALVGRRLHGVPATLRPVLDAVAVAGPSASTGVIAALVERPVDSVLPDVDSLRRAWLLADDDTIDDAINDASDASVDEVDLVVAFAHDRLAEAARAALDDATRATLHGRVAALLEALPSSARAARAAELAWHHDAAGQRDAAIPWLLVAAERARSLATLDDAVRFLERAVTLQEEGGDVAGLARTWMKLGLVHSAAFQAEAAHRAWQRAFALHAELRHDDGAVALPTGRLGVTHGEPQSLDPARAVDSDSLLLVSQLFEGLVEAAADVVPGGGATVLPAVAASWDIDDNGRRYTFHLRSDARWSDGVPVVADDFEQAWKRVLHPRLRSPVAHLLFVLEHARDYHEGRLPDASTVGVRALSPTTLELRLVAPSAYLLYLLTHPATSPIPVHVVRAHGSRWTTPGLMVGNGAFVLEEHDAAHLVLRRNPAFCGRADGNVGVIEVLHYPNHRAALGGWERGELDLLDLIGAEVDVLADIRARFPGRLQVMPLHSTQYVQLRVDRPPLDDVRVRRALALAIDRDALTRSLEGTAQTVARGGFIAPGIAGHSPTLALRGDPARARALLQEAGYASPGDVPVLHWLHTHGVGDRSLVEHVVDAWRALGLRVQLEELDWQGFQRRVEEDPPHVMLGGWIADAPDPDAFLRACFHSTDGAEHIGWQDPRFDALAEDVARLADERARSERAQQADQLLVVDACVVIPLCYGENPVLLGPRVRHCPGGGSYLRPFKHVVVDDT